MRRQPLGRRRPGDFLGLGCIMLVLPTLAQACAVCVGSENDGFFWGVLFLMATPFLIGCSIGGWLLYTYRRSQPGRALPADNPGLVRRLCAPATRHATVAGPSDAAQAH